MHRPVEQYVFSITELLSDGEFRKEQLLIRIAR